MPLLWSLRIYQGPIKLDVENLRKNIGAHGFDRIAPELVKGTLPLRIIGVHQRSLVSFLTSYRIFLA